MDVQERRANGFRVYRHDSLDNQSLSHNHVTSIYEDPTGDLWIGTMGGGVNRMDRATPRFEQYTSKAQRPRC
jgi:hypothetical protein